jgi:hypothetical protein
VIAAFQQPVMDARFPAYTVFNGPVAVDPGRSRGVCGFSLWYSVVNTVGPIVGGAAFHLGRGYLRGAHRPLGVLVVTIGISASYCVCGWRLWTGLQQNAPLWVNYLLCVPVAILAYTVVRIVFAVTRVPGFVPPSAGARTPAPAAPSSRR